MTRRTRDMPPRGLPSSPTAPRYGDSVGMDHVTGGYAAGHRIDRGSVTEICKILTAAWRPELHGPASWSLLR